MGCMFVGLRATIKRIKWNSLLEFNVNAEKFAH